MKIYWEFGNPRRRGSAVSPRSSTSWFGHRLSFSQLLWLSLFFLLPSVPRVYQLSWACGLVLFHWETGDLGNRLISPFPFSGIPKRSYLSFSHIQVSGIGNSSRILDIYMLGRSDIILEPEQETFVVWFVDDLHYCLGLVCLLVFLPQRFRASIILRSRKQERGLRVFSMSIECNSYKLSRCNFTYWQLRT